MAKKINLRSPKVKAGKRQTSTYGTQTPLSSTAVERGSTRWLNGSRVDIDGVLDVTGTASVGGLLSVSGTLNASGQINLSGSTGITGPLNITGTTTIGGNTNITGELNVTGPTTLDGDTEVGGLLDITGKTTIRNDLELLSGGILKAGVTKIEPNGKATFGDFVIDPSSNKLIQAPGGWMFSDGPDHLGLASSLSSSVQLGSTQAELNFKGDYVRVNENGTAVSKAIRVSTGTTFFEISQGRMRCTALPTTTLAPNVYMDGTGVFFRTSWTP